MFQNKTVAVIGLARAGIPAARFLLEKGARVLGYDGKSREEISPEVLELEAGGVELHLGDHNFAGLEAADILVLSPGLKVHYEPLKTVIESVEERGGEVIGELELAYRFCPCPIVAVTGTKGKSTTVKLITEMLRACDVDAVAAGNTGTPLIAVLPQLSPESWAIVEVSSFQLEKAPTFRPKVAVLLSLLEDHQDYHPTLEQYWETKLKIFANQEADDIRIVNLDDERVGQYWQSLWDSDPPKVHGYVDSAVGQGSIGYFSQTRWDYYRRFIPLMSFDEIPLKGRHNLSNVQAALYAVLHVLPVPRTRGLKGWVHDAIHFFDQEPEPLKYHSQIAQAIRNFQSLPHRLEIVAEKNGVRWVNDSQSTIPDASIAALNAFPSPVSLIAGGRAKIGAESYQKWGRAVAEKARHLYLIGEAAEMLSDVAQQGGMEKDRIFIIKQLSRAVERAKMDATPGETVVLSPACASFDQWTSYEARGAAFRNEVLKPSAA